ncbi:hypothetical protein CUN85_05445 [Methanolobus halotolerans]|uniref:Uncharacterized protein n=2 Tax=Methanolobus halotolerans TaxID=2052935 RepID=A0A4E0Q6J9_9EURY|nr:hypothetical protein CUN85_05445 [Methanolobus halotolerans]
MSDIVNGLSQNPQQYIRFYKIGIFFTAAFGLYLGIQGLYLMIVANNFITGIPLFIAAILIAPPPVGISAMLKQQFNIDISMAARMLIATLLLLIAWLSLP